MNTHKSDEVGKTTCRARPDTGSQHTTLHAPEILVPPTVPVRMLLTAAQAAKEVFGVSERKFQQLRTQPWMPLPIELGPRALRWVRSELEQAVSNMPRSHSAKEPTQLLRARIEKLKGHGAAPATAGHTG